MNTAHYFKAMSAALATRFGQYVITGGISGKRATWDAKIIADYNPTGVVVNYHIKFITLAVRNEGGQKWVRIRIKTPFASRTFTLPVIHISLAAEESLLAAIANVALELWQEAQQTCVADVRTADLADRQFVRVTGTIPCRDDSLGTVYVTTEDPTKVCTDLAFGCAAVAFDNEGTQHDVVAYCPGVEIDADMEDEDDEAGHVSDFITEGKDVVTCTVCDHEVDENGHCFCGDHEDVLPTSKES